MVFPTQRGTIPIATLIVVLLGACTATPPTVIEALDESTGATVTYSETPINMSPDTDFARANTRPYVDMGAIRVNRNRVREYFLWLGIWDVDYAGRGNRQPAEFESVVIVVDGEPLALEVHGWSHAAIGSSGPVYKRLFPDAADAYYAVSLEQIGQLAAAADIRLRTGGAAPREFVPWYRVEKAQSALAAFFRRVSE